MISEVYAAFRKAGVQEEDARMVAEALSAESLAKKDDVRKLDKELLIIKLMLGLIIAIQVMLILRASCKTPNFTSLYLLMSLICIFKKIKTLPSCLCQLFICNFQVFSKFRAYLSCSCSLNYFF